MIVLGLTGSIGMGKSTTANLFRAEGIEVFDADAVVHGLYRGKATPLIEAVFPGTTEAGVVDRLRLGARVLGDPAALQQLEAIVHPLVREAREEFLCSAKERGLPLVVLDIPLLLENAADTPVDAVLLVTAPEAVQKERLAQRPGMTEARLEAILARQMPDADKRKKANYIIDTSLGLASAEADVRDILRKLIPGPK
ncbi:dephospho-CoA kinase [Methyloferula stellata]|uniref:dephospho-CoA kinase n=1 Tax=Methyloferula stellata TaxID=876270 RepID=UPI0003742E24|nr:dephospho-CoA kinase [Methyloferula stellata]